MKHSMALMAALRSSARPLLEPGSLGICHNTILARPVSRSSQQDHRNKRWQSPAEDHQRPFSAKAGTVIQPGNYANAHHTPSNSWDYRQLQTRTIHYHTALAQGSTDSRISQGSSVHSKEDDPGVPQPASTAPAGMLGCHIPDPACGHCRQAPHFCIVPLQDYLTWPTQACCCPFCT